MRDAIVFGVLVGAFAAAVTCHLTLAVSLANRRSRARGLVALVIPPLAPCLGFCEHMRIQSAGWLASVVVYVVARLLG